MLSHAKGGKKRISFLCQRCEKRLSICKDIISTKELDTGLCESNDQRLEDLFVSLSLNSTSDHPLCNDCAQANIVELAQVNHEIMGEITQYKDCLLSLRNPEPSEPSTDDLDLV